MTDAGRLSAIAVRRCALAIVLAECLLATVVNHDDTLLVMVDWLPLVSYVVLCAEPVRWIYRTTRVSIRTAAMYLVTALASSAWPLLLPVSFYAASGKRTVAAVPRLFGVRDLSGAAAGTWSSAAWIALLVAILGALAMWAVIGRLARRAGPGMVNHAAGDGGLATWATLDAPLGTTVTRPHRAGREQPGGFDA